MNNSVEWTQLPFSSHYCLFPPHPSLPFTSFPLIIFPSLFLTSLLFPAVKSPQNFDYCGLRMHCNLSSGVLTAEIIWLMWKGIWCGNDLCGSSYTLNLFQNWLFWTVTCTCCKGLWRIHFIQKKHPLTFSFFLREWYVDLNKNCSEYTQGKVDTENVEIKYLLLLMT